MKKTTIKMGIAAAMCGLGLVAGLVPASAFADNSGTTDVKVKTDPASTQLTFEVPTLIQFGVDSAGTLTGPSPEVLNITNKSVFPIHVTNMTATAKTPFVLGDTAAADAADNTLDFTIDGHKASDGSTDLSADATFNLGYADSATASHQLTVANGKIVKVNQDLTKNPSVASVTWTLAAGAVA